MKKDWWNPMAWMQTALEAVWGIISGIWTAFLGIFGIRPRAPSGRHEDIKLEDIDQAATAEAAKQDLADILDRQRTPAEIVHAYAAAGAMDRPTVDLSALSEEQQDWLVSLSDSDYILLSASGVPACERSLRAGIVIPTVSRLHAEKPAKEAPQAVIEQTKEEMIRDRYLASIRGVQPRHQILRC
ncbi:hypothetical protein ASG25_21220 [Rhizobium sp. Leaf384]|uniref:hypothetical protein n=1 Tax=unclassified Rhizobium TaxID=2613769 RepID=UPI000712CEF7|nr:MULTISPECIES: hypothetical protein [unclassified Rhizobium]KQS74320.1 hypothetical protein ASG25_21220 [Rhizobium sp. Leaf384]KQS83964.1 hypothetical protein ASG58_21605 [Rhizobium sp. Leaf383]